MSWWRALARDHPRHLIAGALAAGLALASIGPLAVFIAAFTALLFALALELRAHVALAVCALLLAGYGIGGARLAAIDADPLARAPSGPVELRGNLTQLPRLSASGFALRVRAEPAGQLVDVRATGAAPDGLRIGDEVVLRGRLQAVNPASARTPEARSYAEYLLRNGVRRRLTAREVSATGRGRPGLTGAIDAVRSRAEVALAVGLAPEPAALLRGMVLGGDAGLPEQTVDDFRVAGLSHILAVSGQNVLLIVILVQAILVAAGAARSWRLIIPAAVILIYVALCGAQASVVRAGAMGLAGLAAIAASRPSSRLYALILAAIVVLLWNPRATLDVGAQLSFAAVLGLIAFTRPLAVRFSRLPGWCAEALAATAGATLATAPLMAFHFGAVSIVSLAANVAGEPLMGPIVWLGSLSAAIGQVSARLAGILNAPTGFLLGALIELAHTAAAMPGAQVQSKGFGTAWLVAGCACVTLIALRLNGRLPLPALPYRQATPAIAAVLAAFVLLPARGAQTRGPAIVMLDVGQGDATLLLGEGCSALIDGGPPGDRLAEKLRAYGVRRLDAVVVTHPETDHFGGVLDLAESDQMPVATFIDGGGNTPRPEFGRLRAGLKAEGAGELPAVAGARWSCPGIDLKVIAPPAQSPGAPPPANPNTRAAVTSVSVGPLTMLASGDAESPQLLPLALPPAEILKTPHHGSDDPGLSALLERVRPRIALIGVGAHNRYGHPTPSTLSALGAAGVETMRTDRDGDIVVTPAGVSTRGSGR